MDLQAANLLMQSSREPTASVAADCTHRDRKKHNTGKFNSWSVPMKMLLAGTILLLCTSANAQVSATDYFANGNAKYNAGNYKEAVELYTKAIDLKPTNDEAFSN